MKLDKSKVAVWVLAILLLVAICYIGYGVYQNVQYRKESGIYNLGMQTGYIQAVDQLLARAATCQTVPVTMGNVTLNLIATECLQPRQ